MKVNLLASLFVVISWCSVAQQDPNQYAFSTNDTSTLYELNNSDTLIGSNQDNVITDAYRLPFVFGAMGGLANTYSVNVKGQVYLSPSAANYYQLTPFAVMGSASAEAWNARDMGTSATGSVRAQTFGTHPYRKFVIEFSSMSFKKNTGANNGTFQVVLHESTGSIQYIYGHMNVTDTLISAYNPMVSYLPSNKHVLVDPSTHALYSAFYPSGGNRFPGAISGLHSPINGSCRSYTFTPNQIDNFVDTVITFDYNTSGLSNLVIPEYDINHKYIIAHSTDSNGSFDRFSSLESTLLSGVPNSNLYVRLYKSNGNAISTNYASGTATFGNSRTFVTQQSGHWNDVNTWGTATNVFPIWGDTVIVSVGDTLYLNGFFSAYAAFYLKVDGVVNFASSNKVLQAFDIEVSNGGIILAHNATTVANPNFASGNTIYVIRNLAGAGTLDMRYSGSTLSIGSGDSIISSIGVNFAQGNNNMPLLHNLELRSATQVMLNTQLTITRRIDGNSGTLVTNGNLRLDGAATVGTQSPGNSFVINRFAKMALFQGAVTHGANHNLSLNYFNRPNQVVAYDYVPTPFVAGAEIPSNDSLYELTVRTPTGVEMDRAITVTNTLNIFSGNIYCGNHDFSFLGSDFSISGGGIVTTGWVKRFFYNYPYNGGMENPGWSDRLFPIIADGYKRYAYLQGAVSGDGLYGVKHHQQQGSTLFASSFIENNVPYNRRSNAYWQVQTPAGSTLTNISLHLRASGITDEMTAGICFENGAAPGTSLSAMGGAADAITRRTALNSSLLGNNLLYVSLANSTPLPVSLLSFDASKKDETSLLDWRVADDGIEAFVVERSSDGVVFEVLGYIGAHTNEVTQHYKFTDEQPNAGNNFYRIRLLGKDGSQSYSSIKMLHFGKKANAIHVYPNPANNELNINYDAVVDEQITIQAFDVTGKLILSTSTYLQKGNNKLWLNISQLTAGLYHFHLVNSGGSPLANFKVMKQN